MQALVCAGILFQLPGLLLAGTCGIGAANFLKNPAPWLRCVTSGGECTHKPLPCHCNCTHLGQPLKHQRQYWAVSINDMPTYCKVTQLC